MDTSTEDATLISKDELTLAVRSSHLEFGNSAEVTDFSLKAAPNQGTISLVLQAAAKVNVPIKSGVSSSSEEKTVHMIVKRFPLVKTLLKKNIENRLLEREANFYKNAVPVLQSRCPQISIPRCFFSAPHVIYLQDVSLSDYSNIAETDLTFCHTKLIFEKLAMFHASTININWFEILPHISIDCVFEATDEALYRTFCTACVNYAHFITSSYPDVNIEKYLKLLSNENNSFFNTLRKFIKPHSKYLNVLTHGDCWTNNILFKLNPKTKSPEDLYFIDFPYARFVPPSRDIQYFLYNCTNSNFRDLYETELLKYYVEVFNKYSRQMFGDSNAQVLSFDEFYEEYNSSRLYGICMALMFRTFSLVSVLRLYYSNKVRKNKSPEEKASLSAKGLEEFMYACKVDQVTGDEVRLIATEFMKIVDDSHFNNYFS